jgi:hypothetical protein
MLCRTWFGVTDGYLDTRSGGLVLTCLCCAMQTTVRMLLDQQASLLGCLRKKREGGRTRSGFPDLALVVI